MDRIRFSQLPLVARIMNCASIFVAWVLFAEFAIDRYGWNVYLPYYRVADICPYDLLVLALIAWYWYLEHRNPRVAARD